jgi:beta-1,2-mannobiose phosphorylase / 1,2-beta-oligomannan phosphorylase
MHKSVLKVYTKFIPILLLTVLSTLQVSGQKQQVPGYPVMMFGDTSRTGIPFSKDPHVISFKGRYLMYYSVPAAKDNSTGTGGWGIGIAESSDLVNWKKAGEITPAADYENKGLCAPCARVIDGKVHLFYQTYGNGKNDAICHAVSVDGIQFTRDASNPVFHPDGTWNCGRAIDAEVIFFRGNYYLYYATRDPDYKIQMQGVAIAPGNTDFKRNDWKNISTEGPILKPELEWEKDCIEGASVIERNGKLYMFYAGAYNNAPQQIGVAVSTDAVHWERLPGNPFLSNGRPDEWNSSESGHPHIFEDTTGKTWLFFQGNNDKGKSWYISKVEVKWNRKGPYLNVR